MEKTKDLFGELELITKKETRRPKGIKIDPNRCSNYNLSKGVTNYNGSNILRNLKPLYMEICASDLTPSESYRN